MAVIDYSSPAYGGNKYTIDGAGLFDAWTLEPDPAGRLPARWVYQGRFNLGQLANRVSSINAYPWLFKFAAADNAR